MSPTPDLPGTIETPLRAFLNAHDKACAENGRNIHAQGNRAAVSRSFGLVAHAADDLADTITRDQGHPLNEAMARAVVAYREAAIWTSQLQEIPDDEPLAEFDGQRILLPDATGAAAQRTLACKLDIDAVRLWTEWAPRFFEHVGLPHTPAPNLWPTYPLELTG